MNKESEAIKFYLITPEIRTSAILVSLGLAVLMFIMTIGELIDANYLFAIINFGGLIAWTYAANYFWRDIPAMEIWRQP